MKQKKGSIGRVRQYLILLQRVFKLFFCSGEYVSLLVTIVSPFLVGLVVSMVSKENFMVNYEGTKSALFTMVSAAIYIGMFNSLTAICKERRIIKREYMTGMHLSSFIYAHVTLQLFICLVQSALFLLVYYVRLDLVEKGLILSETVGEYYISLFLIMMASDMMGLFVSSLVKSNEVANLIAPILILAQLILSGVLFTLEGLFQYIAAFTVSRWGMEAVGSITDLNHLPLKLQALYPQIPHEVEEAYEAGKEHLLHSWGMLVVFILVLSCLCVLCLRSVERDKR